MTDLNNEQIENTENLSAETPENSNEENINDKPEELSSELENKDDIVDREVAKEEDKIELQVNEEALKEQTNSFGSIKTEIEQLKTTFDSMEGVKHERKKMAELKERLLSLFLLSKSERDEQIDIIQQKFEDLKKSADRIKDEINSKLEENLKEIEPKVHTVLKEAESPENFGEVRKKLIELQNELKDYEIHRDKKDDFFSLVQKAFESLNEQQDKEREEYEMEISENYLNVKPKVAEAIRFAVTTDNYNKARESLIECQKELKNIKLKKDHLDELFGLIRKAFENVNQKQDKEREHLKEKSIEEYNSIKPKVDEAIIFADETDDYEEARKRLIETQKVIKTKSLTRNQRDELYGAIREVFTRLNEKQDSNREEFIEECNENFSKLEIKVNESIAYIDFTNDLNDIREGLLAVQDEVKIIKLTRTQRNELFKRIREGFNNFDEKRNEFIKSRKKYKKAQLEDKIENKKETLEKVEDQKIEKKVKEDIQSAEEKIIDLENQIDKLED